MCVVCISYLCKCVMYLCVCAVCVCVWTYTGVQRPEVDAPMSSILLYLPVWFRDFPEAGVNRFSSTGWPASSRDTPVTGAINFPPRLHWSYRLMLLYPASTGGPGTQTQVFCLHNQHFIQRAISPDPVISSFDAVVTPNHLMGTVNGRRDLLGSQFQRVSGHLGRLGMVLHYWEAWGSVNQEIGSVLLLRGGLFSKLFLKWAYF